MLWRHLIAFSAGLCLQLPPPSHMSWSSAKAVDAGISFCTTTACDAALLAMLLLQAVQWRCCRPGYCGQHSGCGCGAAASARAGKHAALQSSQLCFRDSRWPKKASATSRLPTCGSTIKARRRLTVTRSTLSAILKKCTARTAEVGKDESAAHVAAHVDFLFQRRW